jgi:thioredoxin-related protein
MNLAGPETRQMNMKRTIIGLLACCAALTARADELHWLTDLPKAETEAKADHKLVLLDFTGSDWCGWCIKFDKEVFSTPAFADYARKNLVLVQLDFPQKKKLDAKLQKANDALRDKYGVKGYPTFIILNAEGKEVGRQVGYSEGGPKPFIAKLDQMKGK